MRRPTAALLAGVVAVACTAGSDRPIGDGAETSGSGPAPAPARPVTIPVIAAASEDGAAGSLAGIDLATERVNDDGGIGDRPLEVALEEAANAEEALRSALATDPPVVVVVGSAEAVAAVRPEIEAARTPVVLVGGDAYTAQQMHRYLFQTSVPVRWQARVIASYLLEDRRHGPVAALVRNDPAGEVAGDALGRAFVEEGGPPPSVLPLGGTRQPLRAAAGAEAVVAMLPPGRLTGVIRSLGRLPSPPRLVLPPEALSLGDPVPAGAVACAPYTWAGWAGMLPRVAAFRRIFTARYGEPPGGLEQEGYDAVMALAEALERTGGRGGDEVVRVLEGFRDETYSSVPVRLGPDDHVLAEESHLGLFAVTDPTDAPEGEAFGPVPWRPLMRTFTTDGEKVNLLDRDKRVFFPFWRPKRPTPKYRRSEYGIVTGSSDPLH